MIPQPMAREGPYADLWSYLKSLQHALKRALHAQTSRDLTALDKERLTALARWLRRELTIKTSADLLTLNVFAAKPSREPVYALDIDLPQMIKSLPSFEAWLAAQKLGFDKKWQKLVTALETYTQNLGDSLLPHHPPQEEFHVLQDLLSELVLHAEGILLAGANST